MDKYISSLSQEFKLRSEHVKNILDLLEDGNTIPFIARYRKELTGSVDDQTLRSLSSGTHISSVWIHAGRRYTSS